MKKAEKLFSFHISISSRIFENVTCNRPLPSDSFFFGQLRVWPLLFSLLLHVALWAKKKKKTKQNKQTNKQTNKKQNQENETKKETAFGPFSTQVAANFWSCSIGKNLG